MPKLGFLPSAMHVQEGLCVHRILHAYTGRNLQAHKLKQIHTRKNKPMHARTSLRTQERTQKVVLRYFPSFLNQNST